jgi:type IV pilus assembly protein PilW
MKRCGAQGFTLTEIMLALLITSLTVAGAMQMYSVGRSGYQTAENLARLEERAAYALTEMAGDIRRAGYWGLHVDGTLIATPAELGIHCGGTNVSAWAGSLAPGFTANDGSGGIPCPGVRYAAAANDTLTVRYAGALPRPPDASRVQLHANALGGILFADGNPPALEPPGQIHDLRVRAWYVGADSSEPPLPALRRYTLGSGGLLENQEIMPGVEAMQVRLGVDRDGDGRIDGFTDPQFADDARILAVQIWLLLRTRLPEPGHVDAGPWQSIDPDVSAHRPGDGFRRIAVQRTFRLRNSGQVG